MSIILFLYFKCESPMCILRTKDRFWKSKDNELKLWRKLVFHNGEFKKRIFSHYGAILFEGLYFEAVRDIVLLIAFSFSIAEMVA